VSFEKIHDNDLTISDDYPGKEFVKKPTDASRITALAETRLSFVSLGLRFRSYKGNYVDLEDIISTNLLYDSMGANDTRTEMSFNFSLGDTKGFSPSVYYTQSELTSQESSDIYNEDGVKFKAVTKARAYGVNLSYRF
jgi:hypothetical protein